MVAKVGHDAVIDATNGETSGVRNMSRSLRVQLFILLFALLTVPAAAMEKADVERRSTIVEVEGFSFLSDDKTLRDIREAAYADSRRRALGAAAQWVQSYSQVENFELKVNLVESAAIGQVRVLESKDHGIQPDNRYKVWIKAEVAYDLREPEALRARTTTARDDAAAARDDPAMRPDAPLSVRVWSEKKIYRAGDKLEIYLRGNKDFYARIFLQDVAGNSIQLLPNRYRKENHFKGATDYVVPSGADAFSLTISEPFGKEAIVVFASTAPMPDVGGQTTRSGLLVANIGRSDIALRMRGVSLSKKTAGEGAEANESAAGEFVEAEWRIETQEK